MSDKCSKCFAEQSSMESRVEGGVCYKFCSLCTHLLERDGRSFNLQYKFLQEDHGDFDLTGIERNMLEARIKRHFRGELV